MLQKPLCKELYVEFMAQLDLLKKINEIVLEHPVMKVEFELKRIMTTSFMNLIYVHTQIKNIVDM